MGREITLFESEERKSRADVSAFLRAVAEKIDTGRVTLKQGDTELALDLPGQLVLEIKVEDEEKGGKGMQHSLEIEIKWWEGIEDSGGVELG
ncbi:MAG: amphi-Trp domain-containing protein [Rhodobacteraceae bacterium]|nr:amphi-Trp domain-containing protein [Paracoccaceae bacterium]